MKSWRRRSVRNLLFTFGAFLQISTSARADEVEIKGKVVDAGGQPVADVQLDDYWSGNKGGMKPGGNTISDSEGRFALKIQFSPRGTAVLAIDAAQTRGAVALITTNNVGESLTLKLEPLITVRGEFTCHDLGAPPEWSNVYMSLMPDKVRVAGDFSDPPRFSFKLPPGEYDFNGYGTDVQGLHQTIHLKASEPVVDLQKIDLKATPMALHYGKPAPPWHVTAARGLPRNVKVSDFRGRWLLVEFWGFW